MKVYHGIINKNLESMLAHGVLPNSYWGSKALAFNYSDCGKIIEIDSADYTLSPNETLANHYIDTDPDDETTIQWTTSNQTWKDSLEIFDSVIIEDRVMFSKHNIIEK